MGDQRSLGDQQRSFPIHARTEARRRSTDHSKSPQRLELAVVSFVAVVQHAFFSLRIIYHRENKHLLSRVIPRSRSKGMSGYSQAVGLRGSPQAKKMFSKAGLWNMKLQELDDIGFY